MEETKQNRPNKRFTPGVIVGIILCVVLVPALVVNLTLIIKSFTRPDEVPSFMGYKPFIVLTGSMEPVFYSGDLVLCKEIDTSELKAGDIIAFREGKAVVTHRIQFVETTDDGIQFVTKGDNNNATDRKPVLPEVVEGIYLSKISGLGNLAMFMQTPIGMALFIAVPLIGFILYDVLRRMIFERQKAQHTQELHEELQRMRKELEERGKENSEEE